jgi:ZIP family zinc transporter
MPIFSWAFLQRLLSFAVGSFLYFLMSKYAFPEPEDIISNHFELHPLTISRKSSDDGNVNECTNTNQSPTNNNVSAIEINPNGKLNSNLQRRGTFTEDTELATRSIDDERKTRGASNPKSFTSCISSLRIFLRGSDLATSEARRANRVAMLLFFSLLLHNFPEGLAVAASALESDQLGMTVTIGIMIHNIPEGIAIAIPCLKARPDNPRLCFVLASVSGLAEPLGAIVSLTLLRRIERRQTSVVGDVAVEGDIEGEGSLENVLAFVAGVMIAVSLLELFPEAKRHTELSGMKPYYAGLTIGFLVMIGTEFGMSL